jgi:branched-chain amino acid transport system permease protein
MIRNTPIKISGIAAFTIFLLVLPLFIGNIYWISVLIITGINVLLACSMRMVWLIGKISLGQVGFSLIGGYASALLAIRLGMPFGAAFILGVLFAAAIALLLSYPFLKVKGIYFAILTLLTAETFRSIAYFWKSLTGGHDGLLGIKPPDPITIPFIGMIDFNTENGYYYIMLLVVLVSLFILYKLEYSEIGFRWRLINDSEDFAQSIGINTMRFKMLNFTIAGFFAGVSGVLFAFYQQGLSPHYAARFGPMMSIYLVIYMVVGGEAKFLGPIIGTIVLMFFAELLRPLQEYQPIIFGVLAIIVAIFASEGLVGLKYPAVMLFKRLQNISIRLKKA